MGTHRKRPSKRKGKKGRTASPYPFALRLKVVRLYLEDGYPSSLVAEQFGISAYSVYRWSRLYRQQGEQALKSRQTKSPTKSKQSAAVTQSIVKLKKEIRGTVSDGYPMF